MKFSLKYKLPLYVLLGFASFIVALILYYRLFLMDNLGRDFDLFFKDHLYQITDQVSTQLKKDYPDRDKIAKFLDKVSARQNAKITIYDVAGNRIASADRRKGYGLNLELKSFTVVGRNTIYVVELLYPFTMDSFGELNFYRKVRDMAQILLVLMLLLLMIYLHFSLGRPLVTLNRGLESLDYRSHDDGRGYKIPARFYKRHDELGDLARKFAAMQQRLSASYREQTEMIASISHDLKTPLTSIIGFLERLMSQKLPEERQTEYHRIIYQKARDINKLIAEFSLYVTSDLENNVPGSRDTVNLEEFFEALCAEYTVELKARGLDCPCRNEAGTDNLWLEIDIQSIRRVFANLVSNSLKYAEKLSKITFRCSIRDNSAVFTVEDDGPGVPAGELAAIFDKFYRVDKSRSREKGGSGLGLAICRRIVESHGGNIWAYLPEQGGFGVSFALPLKSFHKT
jgi:signal transduction histidine kinase